MMMMDGMGAWGCSSGGSSVSSARRVSRVSSGVSSVRSGVGNSRRNRHTDSCMEFRRGEHDSVGDWGNIVDIHCIILD